jgi:hypothetical protein
MSYVWSIPQDEGCQSCAASPRGKCDGECGYARARAKDNWAVPPVNPEIVLHSDGISFYEPWLSRLRTIAGIITP